MNQETAFRFLTEQPVRLGWALGFDRLTDLHNNWIRQMVWGKVDETLQGHRGSYKTTCVSIALALVMILKPSLKIAFIRKTDDDVKEIIKQTRNILLSAELACFTEGLYGVRINLIEDNAVALSTNLVQDIKGASQLTGFGTKSSVTGKHYDLIYTDDIVNKEDRASRAEREKTKLFYQELINLKNRGGRIFNSGTPWHPDDAFTMMPPPQRFDCYNTGLITKDELEELRQRMTRSLFAANYELKHISDEDILFPEPVTEADPALVEQGICQLDAAYGGEDGTAFTIMRRFGVKYYVYGKLWQKHVDDCLQDIVRERARFNAGKIYCESNADKGYLAKELKRRGERTVEYFENQNKYIKISTYLKAIWKDVEFVAGTDQEYINQICDYNENAEHDDAPDSCAVLARLLWRKNPTEYSPLIIGR